MKFTYLLFVAMLAGSWSTFSMNRSLECNKFATQRIKNALTAKGSFQGEYVGHLQEAEKIIITWSTVQVICETSTGEFHNCTAKYEALNGANCILPKSIGAEVENFLTRL